MMLMIFLLHGKYLKQASRAKTGESIHHQTCFKQACKVDIEEPLYPVPK